MRMYSFVRRVRILRCIKYTQPALWQPATLKVRVRVRVRVRVSGAGESIASLQRSR